MIARILPLMCCLSLIACDGGTSTTKDSGGTDTSGNTDTDETNTPDPETDCGDGIDNDEDGLADCLDDDCAAEFSCTWPDTIGHRTQFNFDGYEVECDLGIFDKEFTVDDCVTDIRAQLSVATDGDLCTDCDRTYAGTFNYETDTCTEPEDMGDRPTEGRFGFVFVSETERELWALNDAGAWEYAITMPLKDGRWSHTDAGEIEYEYDDCRNSPLTVGNLAVTLSFTDQ